MPNIILYHMNFKKNIHFFVPLWAVIFAICLQTSCSKDNLLDMLDEQPTFDISLAPDAYPNLSDYGFFKGNLADMSPIGSLIPYDLNTPLFSDYAQKARFIYVPPGTSANYTEDGVLDFPVGSIIVKTFYYQNDFNDSSVGKRIIETRLLLRKTDKWEAASYLWNEAQTEAVYSIVGKTVAVEWIHTDGSQRSANYVIPNQNDCKSCHNISQNLLPIGPKVRNINKLFNYSDGPNNQIERWRAIGYLTGGPEEVATAPKVPNWRDETIDVALRARAYLDVNCAHCHNPDSPADNTGLNLDYNVTDPVVLGICKTPVAAGNGSGGLRYDILPGQPDESIMVYRMNATEIDVAMPEVGRSVIHTEGVQLIREWIDSLEGECR